MCSYGFLLTDFKMASILNKVFLKIHLPVGMSFHPALQTGQTMMEKSNKPDGP